MVMNCLNEGQIHLLYMKTRNQEKFLITEKDISEVKFEDVFGSGISAFKS